MTTSTTDTPARVTYISSARAQEENQSWTPDTIYGVQGTKEGQSKFFWSPDGVGRYFYETLEELREDSGL